MNNETALILQAQQGRDDAFTLLVEQYQTAVFNLCYRMLGEVELAEDAAQETFLRAYTNLASYDRQRSFATWLLSVSAHYCIDRLRRKRHVVISMDAENDDDEAVFELPDQAAVNPEREMVRREEQHEIQIALQKLDAQDRAAIVLRYWYDFSEVEIAESLNLTVSAVKSRLFRARKTVARQLAEVSEEARDERKPYGTQAL